MRVQTEKIQRVLPNWINNRLVANTELHIKAQQLCQRSSGEPEKSANSKKCSGRRSEMGYLSLESGRKKPEGETADPVWRRGQLRSKDLYGLRIKIKPSLKGSANIARVTMLVCPASKFFLRILEKSFLWRFWQENGGCSCSPAMPPGQIRQAFIILMKINPYSRYLCSPCATPLSHHVLTSLSD